MLNPILIAMGVNSNNAQVIQGALIAGVMMVGGLSTFLRERRS
jgi:ribose transport system permease protein